MTDAIEVQEPAGTLGPAGKERAKLRSLKKRVTLPIAQVDLPDDLARAMQYRVEVTPVVRSEGAVLDRAEIQPGDELMGYRVYRRGNQLDGLENDGKPVYLDAERFRLKDGPVALEKALARAKELAEKPLTMDDLVPDYAKLPPEQQREKRDKMFGRAFFPVELKSGLPATDRELVSAENLRLMKGRRSVQLGYENYGEDLVYYTAEKDPQGKWTALSHETKDWREGEKKFQELCNARNIQAPEKKQRDVTPVLDAAATDAKKPEGPEKHVAEQSAPEQSTDDIVKDWPQANAPKKLVPETEVPAPELPAQDNARQEFPRIKPPKTLLGHPRNGKPLVLDHGDSISVTRRAMLGIGKRAQEKRENAVATGLQAAAERFGQPVHFSGSPAFLKETAEMAVKLGITLEPGSKLAEHYYQRALEQKAKEKQVENAKGNFFAQSVGKQKERKLDVGKGLER